MKLVTGKPFEFIRIQASGTADSLVKKPSEKKPIIIKSIKKAASVEEEKA